MVSRELRRNAGTRGGKLEYRASVAQWKADLVAQRPKPFKLVENPRLRDYVQDRLSGVVRGADGEIVGPAEPAWIGRNKPHRGDRRWVRGWSPEQISLRLRVDFPDDDSMRISHEAIYQALYIESRGALKRELVLCLRTGRALRVPRARARSKAWAHVTPEAMISERPDEADDRSVPGHWEGDLIIGLNRSAIGTVVDRTTRFTKLIHLPREEGYGTIPRTKNGPPLAGYGAITMKAALAAAMSPLPPDLARSLTWDRGKELSAHAAFTAETGIAVYFADPHSPWQRGTNENTNGLLRQYFPKGTDLARWTYHDLAAVAAELNSRPPQNPRMAHTRRSPRRSPTFIPTNRCCFHRLNPSSTCRSATPNDSPTPASSRPSGRKATAMTTRWPRPPTGSTRPSSSTGAPGVASTTSRSPPSNTSTGSTTAASTPPAG